MDTREETAGKSVARLAVAALMVGMSDVEVWDTLDAENAALVDALDEGRLADAERHLERVEALTDEAGRRARG